MNPQPSAPDPPTALYWVRDLDGTATLAGRVLVCLLAGLGCAEGQPRVIAEKAGWARWPANSSAAITACIEDGITALEVDVFLTNDRVPILYDGPRLDPETCTTSAGDPISDDVWFLEHDLADLESDWLCGVDTTSVWPDAGTAPAPVHTLEALIGQIEPSALDTIVLDLRWIPNVSHAPEVFAAEVLERWWRSPPSAALVITSDRAETLRAVNERAAAHQRPVETLLRWPPLPPRGNKGTQRVGRMLLADAGLADPWSAAEAAGAAGVVLHADQIKRDDIAQRPAHARVGVEGSSSDHPVTRWLEPSDWWFDAEASAQ